jgi:hypothetical protein
VIVVVMCVMTVVIVVIVFLHCCMLCGECGGDAEAAAIDVRGVFHLTSVSHFFMLPRTASFVLLSLCHRRRFAATYQLLCCRS